jgi:hypothetical protein
MTYEHESVTAADVWLRAGLDSFHLFHPTLMKKLHRLNMLRYAARISRKATSFAFLGIAMFSSGSLYAQLLQNFPNGITLGNPADAWIYRYLIGGNSECTVLENISGGMLLYAPHRETASGNFDGGISLHGTPISMVLGADLELDAHKGKFEIWRHQDFWSYDATAKPAYSIDTDTNLVQFDGLNVTIAGGNLTVAGSAVMTASSAPAVLTGLGFMQVSNLGSALNSLPEAPTGPAWTSAYVPRGNVAPIPGGVTGGLLALGSTGNSVASGSDSIAFGYFGVASGMSSLAIGNNATAAGAYSISIGQNTSASYSFSKAIGDAVTASGFHSLAIGNNITAKARNESVFGCWNKESNPTHITIINGMNGLFRVGNGVSETQRSDAMTILRNGETTLTNRFWKEAVSSSPGDASVALGDPPSPQDSGGNALVVDGHTILNGKVVMAVPQGDISMGVYGD